MHKLCLHKIGPNKSDQTIGPELQNAIQSDVAHSEDPEFCQFYKKWANHWNNPTVFNPGLNDWHRWNSLQQLIKKFWLWKEKNLIKFLRQEPPISKDCSRKSFFQETYES